MPFQQRLISVNQTLRLPFSVFKLDYRFNQSPGVFGASQQVCCFFQSLVVLPRDHDHGLSPLGVMATGA